jgi:hypothetical protein
VLNALVNAAAILDARLFSKSSFADPALMTPAFLHLATADERGVNGQRFDAHKVSAEPRAAASQP